MNFQECLVCKFAEFLSIPFKVWRWHFYLLPNNQTLHSNLKRQYPLFIPIFMWTIVNIRHKRYPFFGSLFIIFSNVYQNANIMCKKFTKKLTQNWNVSRVKTKCSLKYAPKHLRTIECCDAFPNYFTEVIIKI